MTKMVLQKFIEAAISNNYFQTVIDINRTDCFYNGTKIWVRCEVTGTCIYIILLCEGAANALEFHMDLS